MQYVKQNYRKHISFQSCNVLRDNSQYSCLWPRESWANPSSSFISDHSFTSLLTSLLQSHCCFHFCGSFGESQTQSWWWYNLPHDCKSVRELMLSTIVKLCIKHVDFNCRGSIPRTHSPTTAEKNQRQCLEEFKHCNSVVLLLLVGHAFEAPPQVIECVGKRANHEVEVFKKGPATAGEDWIQSILSGMVGPRIKSPWAGNICKVAACTEHNSWKRPCHCFIYASSNVQKNSHALQSCQRSISQALQWNFQIYMTDWAASMERLREFITMDMHTGPTVQCHLAYIIDFNVRTKLKEIFGCEV